MKQYGFFIDISRCTGCKTCTLACKDYKELGPNQNFRRVYEYTGGNWKKEGETWRPDVFAYYVSMACNHCEDPACIPVCPEKAITKDANGFVVIDAEKCIGCRACQKACPYGAPQYSAAASAMLKCDGCRDRVSEGKKPVCVDACPLRALDFLPIDALHKKYGSLSEVAPLKPAHLTRPCLSIMPGRNTRPQGDRDGFIANPKEV